MINATDIGGVIREHLKVTNWTWMWKVNGNCSRSYLWFSGTTHHSLIHHYLPGHKAASQSGNLPCFNVCESLFNISSKASVAPHSITNNYLLYYFSYFGLSSHFSLKPILSFCIPFPTKLIQSQLFTSLCLFFPSRAPSSRVMIQVLIPSESAPYLYTAQWDSSMLNNGWELVKFLCVCVWTAGSGLCHGNWSLSSSKLPEGPLHLNQEPITLVGHLNQHHGGLWSFSLE